MIFSLNYIRANVSGAWAVMNGQSEGLGRLDLSIEGFWRSFGVIILILPLIVIAMFGERSIVAHVQAEVPPLTGGRIAYNLAVIVFDWLAFPTVFAVLARVLGLSHRYGRFIIARNWATLVTAAIATPVYLLHLAGVLPPTVVPLVLLIVLGVSLRFAYLIARIALDVPVSLALPIVLVDFLLSILIQGLLGSGG